jgi:AraC-like DNA-binding protein
MTPKNTPSLTVFELEELLVATELELGITVTILDPHGVLRCGEISLIHPDRWTRRRASFCDLNDPACHQHCIVDLDSRAQRQRRPFVSSCEKQLLELIIPMCSHGDYLGSLCAGSWRPEADDDLDSDFSLLPAFDPTRMERLGTLLSGIALGLSAIWENTRPVDSDSLKAREIRRFVGAYYWQSVRLGDLAEHLGLSSSRASHLVSELTGTSFRRMVRTERVASAAMLLKATIWPITDIATMVGIPDEHHFNRLFKAVKGIPPGKFRRQ